MMPIKFTNMRCGKWKKVQASSCDSFLGVSAGMQDQNMQGFGEAELQCAYSSLLATHPPKGQWQHPLY